MQFSFPSAGTGSASGSRQAPGTAAPARSMVEAPRGGRVEDMDGVWDEPDKGSWQQETSWDQPGRLGDGLEPSVAFLDEGDEWSDTGFYLDRCAVCKQDLTQLV